MTMTSDELQQAHDNIGEEPCIAYCDGKNTGPQGICTACRDEFKATFRDRNTYERIAFGFDEKDRVSPDRMADLIFGKVAQLAIPEKAKRLIVGGDPAAIALAEEMLQLDDQTLLDVTGSNKAEVEKIEAQAREMIDEYAAPQKMKVQIGRAIIIDRILERHGKKIPSTKYKVEITASKSIDKRADVLLELPKHIEPGVLKEALYVEGVDIRGLEPDVIAKIIKLGAKPIYGFHAGKLRTLAKDCGGKVAEIVAKGVIDIWGQPNLIFEALPGTEKNVTPLRAAS